ncbi:hypothetical protein D3C76_1830080 [compost metagenome]
MQIDPGVIEVYRQDGAIESPDKPVKPMKLMIVVLGAFAGLVLGILLALVRHFWLTMPRRNLKVA